MKSKKNWLIFSVLMNVLLLIGWLFLMYGTISMIYRYDSFSGTSGSYDLHVLAQKVLLESVIEGYEKERVLEMVKKEAAKPENKEMELKISDNSIIFGKIKIVFEDGKVKNVE